MFLTCFSKIFMIVEIEVFCESSEVYGYTLVAVMFGLWCSQGGSITAIQPRFGQ